jgi:hypothetical protein
MFLSLSAVRKNSIASIFTVENFQNSDKQQKEPAATIKRNDLSAGNGRGSTTLYEILIH